MKVMIQEFMSSEESGDEIIDGKRRAVIKVKPLSWRFSRIGRIFKRLDHKIEKRKSKQQTVLPCNWQSISKTMTGRVCIGLLQL